MYSPAFSSASKKVASANVLCVYWPGVLAMKSGDLVSATRAHQTHMVYHADNMADAVGKLADLAQARQLAGNLHCPAPACPPVKMFWPVYLFFRRIF